MIKKLGLLLIVFIPLLSAALIYHLYRADSIVFNYLFSIIPSHFNKLFSWKPPYWFVYSLPGALWLFSFIMIMLFWPFKQRFFNAFFWLVATLSIALGIEFMQMCNFTDGVYDIFDVFSYLIVFLLSVLLFYIRYLKRANIRVFFINPSQFIKKCIFVLFILIVELSDVI
jgi:hypothetical protein